MSPITPRHPSRPTRALRAATGTLTALALGLTASVALAPAASAAPDSARESAERAKLTRTSFAFRANGYGTSASGGMVPVGSDRTALSSIACTSDAGKAHRNFVAESEVPGLGTVSNAIVLGLAADATLAVLDRPDDLAWRGVLMVAAVGLNGLATAAYIGAQLGRGPRDGLMTGLHRRTGLSIRLVRTSLEVTVVVIGLLLGGTAGLGTVLYALAIGPVTQALLPSLVVALPAEPSLPHGRDVTPARC